MFGQWGKEESGGRLEDLKAQARRPNHPFRRARVLVAVVECTGALFLGVLLIPRDRLILVIKGTWVSFPRPYKSESVSIHIRKRRESRRWGGGEG